MEKQTFTVVSVNIETGDNPRTKLVCQDAERNTYEFTRSINDYNTETKKYDIVSEEKEAKVNDELLTHLGVEYAELMTLEGSDVELYLTENFSLLLEPVEVLAKFDKSEVGEQKTVEVTEVRYTPKSDLKVIFEVEGEKYFIRYNFQQKEASGYLYFPKKESTSMAKFMKDFKLKDKSPKSIQSVVGKTIIMEVKTFPGGSAVYNELKVVL
jgi:hypothetical protein